VFDNSLEPNSPQAEPRDPAGRGRALPFSEGVSPLASEHVDVFQYLERLRELVERTPALFGRRVLLGFKHEEFNHLILKIRANLPQDVKQARRIKRDEAAIKTNAEEQARRITSSAEQRAEALVADAQRRAQDIAGRAQQDADLLRSRAEDEASRIVSSAQAQAARMVSETEIMRVAQEQANQLVRNAEAQADDIRRGADQYARDVLAHLSTVLQNALTTVERGREMLERDS